MTMLVLISLCLINFQSYIFFYNSILYYFPYLHWLWTVKMVIWLKMIKSSPFCTYNPQFFCLIFKIKWILKFIENTFTKLKNNLSTFILFYKHFQRKLPTKSTFEISMINHCGTFNLTISVAHQMFFINAWTEWSLGGRFPREWMHLHCLQAPSQIFISNTEKRKRY